MWSRAGIPAGTSAQRKFVLITLLMFSCMSLGAGQCSPKSDWCSTIVMRPDQRFNDTTHCLPEWNDWEIVNNASVVLLGDFTDITNPVIPIPARVCNKTPGHASNAAYIARLREARLRAGKPPIQFVHMHRFDLVPAVFAAAPGFDDDFLVRTDTSWSSVTGFFTGDRSYACLPSGCRWSDSWGGKEGTDVGKRLRDYIDLKGGSSTYRSVVQYLARPDGNQVYWPTAAIADYRDALYRSWRVAEAKRAMSAGKYDVVELNHKFPQVHAGGHWVDGIWVQSVATLNVLGDTYWTAEPDGYGYPEYVAGWRALAFSLRALGVPFSVTLPHYLWTGEAMDDLATPAVDEGALIREVAGWAKLVMVDRPRDLPATAWASLEQEIRASGAGSVVPFDQGCPLAGD